MLIMLILYIHLNCHHINKLYFKGVRTLSVLKKNQGMELVVAWWGLG